MTRQSEAVSTTMLDLVGQAIATADAAEFEADRTRCRRLALAVGHIDMNRPRRGVWFWTWANLPGFMRSLDGGGRSYSHALLPGWEYYRRNHRVHLRNSVVMQKRQRGSCSTIALSPE